MEKRNIRLLSIISLVLGIFFILNSKTNITGAVISSSSISSTFSSILGILLIIISAIIFSATETLEKKVSEPQVNVNRVVSSRVKKDKYLLRIAEDVCRNQDVQRDINHLIGMFNKGSDSPGSGTKPVFGGVYELRGRNGARVYYHKIEGDKYEILAYSDKSKSTQERVISKLRELYG